MEREHRWGTTPGGPPRADLFESNTEAFRDLETEVRHVRRFMLAYLEHQKELDGNRRFAPEELYFVRETDTYVTELLGFRMRGHPLATIGAFRIPRHRDSPVPHGRQSLGEFLSSPPREVVVDGEPLPPGLLSVEMPRRGETIQTFVRRLQSQDRPAAGVQLGTEMIDFAFDFRFMNPSDVRHFTARKRTPVKTIFRTIHGHVVTGLSRGLRQRLHRPGLFFNITDVVQHRRDRATRLPTLAVNQKFLSLGGALEQDFDERQVRGSLLFHPLTAHKAYLLGTPYEQKMSRGQRAASLQ